MIGYPSGDPQYNTSHVDHTECNTLICFNNSTKNYLDLIFFNGLQSNNKDNLIRINMVTEIILVDKILFCTN